MKQGTLDWFVDIEKKTKIEVGSSSQTMNDLNHETESSFSRCFSKDFEMLYYIVEFYMKKVDRPPLLASLLSLRYLLLRGIEIHGHEDDILDTSNKGNFIGLLELLSTYDENIDEAMLNNAPLFQNDMINSCSQETTKAIVKEFGGDYFSILVDQYPDYSETYHMALCLRFVNNEGDVVERFVGVMPAMETNTLSLKDAVYSLLERHSLRSSNIRGQSYNRATYMNSDITGLKSLIKNETQSAYYIHCFSRQLELTLVELSKENKDCRHCGMFFYVLEKLLNVVVVSWRENEIARESRFEKVAQVFEEVETEISKGLNTCLGPYYKLISNVIAYYSVISEMLDMIEDASSKPSSLVKTFDFHTVCREIESFDFVFMAHSMKTILEVSNDLNVVLHKRDQDIVMAMSLVKPVKEQLQIIRDDGWETLLSSVISFCDKYEYDIKVPNMEDKFIPRIKRSGQVVTPNLHRYQVEGFYSIIDLQLQEINNLFDEVNMLLLICIGSLSPLDSFSCFDKKKLLRLAEIYPNEFSRDNLLHFNDQLDNYVHDMRKDDRFAGLKDLSELSKKLVELNKHKQFNLVYLLIKLVLILPVTTPSVERAFSAMTYVESELRKNICDQQLNDRLVTYIESDVFSKISNDDILNSFQSTETRHEKL